MSDRLTSSVAGDPGASPAVLADQGYALLEEARLRSERLTVDAGSEAGQTSLAAIHNQLGLAGLAISTTFEPTHRRDLLARAHHQSQRPTDYSSPAHALVEVVIDAEDVLADGLANGREIEHLNRAHAHLLHAMDLLDRHLHPRSPPRTADR